MCVVIYSWTTHRPLPNTKKPRGILTLVAVVEIGEIGCLTPHLPTYHIKKYATFRNTGNINENKEKSLEINILECLGGCS